MNNVGWGKKDIGEREKVKGRQKQGFPYYFIIFDNYEKVIYLFVKEFTNLIIYIYLWLVNV